MELNKFSPEYIEFCLQARLPREDFQPGDWYIHLDFVAEGPKVISVPGPNTYRGGGPFGASPYRVWLPLEGDWIEMLLALERDRGSHIHDQAERKAYVYDGMLGRFGRRLVDPREEAILGSQPNLLLSLAREWARASGVAAGPVAEELTSSGETYTWSEDRMGRFILGRTVAGMRGFRQIAVVCEVISQNGRSGWQYEVALPTGPNQTSLPYTSAHAAKVPAEEIARSAWKGRPLD